MSVTVFTLPIFMGFDRDGRWLAGLEEPAKSPKEKALTVYEIRVKGHLDGHWSSWFDGMKITNLDNGETILSGDVRDQAALHGVLNKVRDLNLSLVALNGVDPHSRGVR